MVTTYVVYLRIGCRWTRLLNSKVGRTVSCVKSRGWDARNWSTSPSPHTQNKWRHILPQPQKMNNTQSQVRLAATFLRAFYHIFLICVFEKRRVRAFKKTYFLDFIRSWGLNHIITKTTHFVISFELVLLCNYLAY